MPTGEGDSVYRDATRVFSLIYYPDEVIIPGLDQQTTPDEIESEKPSVFDEFGEPDMNIQPVTGGKKGGGNSGRSGIKRNTESHLPSQPN